MTKPRKTRSATVAESLDPSEIIADRLRLLATRKQDTWWDIGELLNELSSRAKIGSAWALSPPLRRELEISPKQVRTWQLLAQRFRRDLAMRAGPERLALLLDYLEELPVAASWSDPLHAQIVVNDHRVISFNEASLADLKQAKKHAIQTSQKLMGALQKRLNELLSDQSPIVKLQGTTLSQSQPPLLSISGIDPDSLDSLGRVLSKIAKELKKKSPSSLKAP